MTLLAHKPTLAFFGADSPGKTHCLDYLVSGVLCHTIAFMVDCEQTHLADKFFHNLPHFQSPIVSGETIEKIRNMMLADQRLKVGQILEGQWFRF